MELNDKDLRRMKWEEKGRGEKHKNDKHGKHWSKEEDELIEKYGIDVYANEVLKNEE